MSMHTRRILVVEDDPDGADLVRRMLKATGKDPVVAADAEVALAALNGAPGAFHAVIVDLALPQMDGFDLMRVIRETAALRNLPLIAMTAYHTPELKARALDGGFTAYFPKPLDTTLFAQALDRILGDSFENG